MLFAFTILTMSQWKVSVNDSDVAYHNLAEQDKASHYMIYSMTDLSFWTEHIRMEVTRETEWNSH